MTPQQEEERVQYQRAVFDAIPVPTFVVDADVRLKDFNTAAERLLGAESPAALHRRAGEPLRCIHAEANGCGQELACTACIIRRAVNRATAGTATYRERHQAERRGLDGSVSVVEFLVTASLLPYTSSPTAVLVLEEAQPG